MKKQAIPLPHRGARPVVDVAPLAGDAMEHLHAPRAAGQRGPHEVGGDVRIEALHHRRSRRDDRAPPAVHRGRFRVHGAGRSLDIRHVRTRASASRRRCTGAIMPYSIAVRASKTTVRRRGRRSRCQPRVEVARALYERHDEFADTSFATLRRCRWPAARDPACRGVVAQGSTRQFCPVVRDCGFSRNSRRRVRKNPQKKRRRISWWNARAGSPNAVARTHRTRSPRACRYRCAGTPNKRSHARLLQFRRPQQRVEMAVSGVPSAVIGTLQSVRLDLCVKDDARVVDPLAADRQQPQQELVVLERSDAVVDALDIGCEDTDGVEHPSPERQVRPHQADRVRGSDRDRDVAVVDERQRRPVGGRKPGRRGGRPDGQHTTADDVRFGVLVKRTQRWPPTNTAQLSRRRR